MESAALVTSSGDNIMVDADDGRRKSGRAHKRHIDYADQPEKPSKRPQKNPQKYIREKQAEKKGAAENYYVERIVNYRVEANRYAMKEYFQVKWEGWSHESNTWEPPEHVEDCPAAIANYFTHHPEKYEIYLLYGETVKGSKPRVHLHPEEGQLLSKRDKQDGSTADVVSLQASRRSRKVVIDQIEHLWDTEFKENYPILSEAEVKDRRVEQIYDHYRSFELTAYLVSFHGDSNNKRAWVEQEPVEEEGDFYISLKCYLSKLENSIV